MIIKFEPCWQGQKRSKLSSKQLNQYSNALRMKNTKTFQFKQITIKSIKLKNILIINLKFVWNAHCYKKNTNNYSLIIIYYFTRVQRTNK